VLALSVSAAEASLETQYAEKVLGLGPVAYYRLNETSGSVAVSEVGAPGANATYGSGVTLGQNGPRPDDFVGFEPDNLAADFDKDDHGSPVNSSAVVMPTSLGMNSNLGSAALWFKAAPGDIDNQGASMLFYGTDSGGDGFGGQNEMHTHLRPDGRLGLFIRGQISVDTAPEEGTFLDDAWHLLVFTWDRNDAGDDAARLYVDGSEVLSATHDANSFNLSHSLLAGRPADNSTLGNGRIFGGQLDEIALFADRLTADEVRGLYVAATIVPEPATFLIWSMLAALGIGCSRRRRKR
jgi:hypothetical protein